jgi:hypothetical protein
MQSESPAVDVSRTCTAPPRAAALPLNEHAVSITADPDLQRNPPPQLSAVLPVNAQSSMLIDDAST